MTQEENSSVLISVKETRTQFHRESKRAAVFNSGASQWLVTIHVEGHVGKNPGRPRLKSAGED